MSNSGSSSNETGLDAVLAEYRRRTASGEQIDRNQWKLDYPQHAQELQSFFEELDRQSTLGEGRDEEKGSWVVGGEPTGIGADSENLDTLPEVAGDTDGAGSAINGEQTRAVDGRTFGDYELIEEIARGGMGVVYRARHLSLDRVVALKMILSGYLADTQEITRFRLEAQAAAALNHPGIVPIYEVGEVDGTHYYSMALIDGRSLSDLLRDGPLTSRVAADYVRAICHAIAFAHTQGIVHRDLKPGNVLIDADNKPHVTDFGLAKNLKSTNELTATGQVIGTPSYMPPEQARGALSEIAPASDIYSIGAILYHLLTGRPPFQAAGTMETLLQVLDHEPIPVRHMNPDVDADLEAVCHKCLSKEIAHRYASATELEQDLDRYLRGEPVLAKAASSIGRAWRMVVRETRHLEVMQAWGQVWWWHGIIVIVWLTVNAALIAAGVTSVVVHVPFWIVGFGLLTSVVWWYRVRKGPSLSPIEKQVFPIWLMLGLTATITGCINYMLGLEPMHLLPLVALQAGLAFGAMASILGGSFYPLAAACAMVSVIMVALPEYGSLIGGLLLGAGLMIPGWKYSLGG